MKVSIVMPIYNEAELLEAVLQRVRAVPFDKEIILVDDGSTDGTRSIIVREARKPDTRAVLCDHNRGKGAAIRAGLAQATGDIVVIQDADMEYDPAQLPALIEPIARGEARAVFGSRFRGAIYNMRLANRVANHLLAWFVRLVYFHPLSDEATAYKAFDRRLLERLDLRCERFEFCPEATAKTIRAGERIVETPITYYARTWEEGKKIKFRDFIVALWTLLRYRFWRPKD
ncbi:MAG: glycosyltransferase family 2 protein [Candidatus Sumerlaeota bacterium]|nr:glycosyltransferase family 2 protein [Candidatus Sumerlaeota bacterium]